MPELGELRNKPELGALQEIGMETIEIVGIVLGVIAMVVITWDAWRDNRR